MNRLSSQRLILLTTFLLCLGLSQNCSQSVTPRETNTEHTLTDSGSNKESNPTEPTKEPQQEHTPDLPQKEHPPEPSAEAKHTTDDPCQNTHKADDHERIIVVSHPYDANRKKVGVFEALKLSTDGTITRTSQKFEMGVSTLGRIHFTPNGAIGMLVQEGGTIGVFHVDSLGKIAVAHKAFKGKFYAGALSIHPNGQHVYVLDSNWRNNGGGIYRLSIACDGTLSQEQKLAEGKLPYALLPYPQDPSKAVVAAKDLLTSPPNTSVHTLSLLPTPKVTGSANAFGDDDYIISASAITQDAKFALFGDNNTFSGKPNRIAIVALTDNGPKPHKIITPLKDPIELIASPFNNAILIASGLSNALYHMPYDPSSNTPFGEIKALTYKNGKPQLPGKGVMITRGTLKGRVFISENVGIHQVQFEKDGKITDLGVTPFGKGYPEIVGAIGVQP